LEQVTLDERFNYLIEKSKNLAKRPKKRTAKEIKEDGLELLNIAQEQEVTSYEELCNIYGITRNALYVNLRNFSFKCKLDRIIADNKEKLEDENCNKKLMTLPYLKRKKDGWYIPIFETPENLVAIESDGYIYSSRKMLDYKVKLGDRIIIFKDKCSYALFGVYQLVSLTKFDNCKKEILERLFCFDTGIIPEEYWQLADNFYKYRI